MKFAAYTDEMIWAIEETEAAAKSEGEATMRETGDEGLIPGLKVAPIDEGLIEAIALAEESGDDVMFDLIDGELCEVEAVEAA